MNLSEAIRLGAMLSPQGFATGHPTRRCALEAALDAVRGPGKHLGWKGDLDYVAIERLWPIVSRRAVCPVHCELGQRRSWVLLGVVWHLNDFHRWTRERIADWVATVEAEMEAPAETTREAAHVTTQ